MPLTCHSDQVETVTSGLYRASGNGEHEQLRMKFPQVELCSASADCVRSSRLGLSWVNGTRLAGWPQVKRVLAT